MAYPNMVWKIPNLTMAEHMVLMLLAHWSDASNKTKPRRSRIAEYARMTERNVQRTIRSLEAKGLITVEKRYYENVQLSNLYRLHIVEPDIPEREYEEPGQCDDGCDAGSLGEDATSLGEDTTSHRIVHSDTGVDGPVSNTSVQSGDTRGINPQGGARTRAHEKPGTQQGSRLPDDWVPPQAGIAFAREQGMDDEEIDREAAKFRDYWCSIPGQRGRKRDWLATWRNWVRKATERRQRGPGQQHAGGNRQSSGSIVEAVRQSVNARRNQGNP